MADKDRSTYHHPMEGILPYLLDFKKDITENKDPARAKEFWLKLAWEVETCVEAQEVFPDMTICPVCLEHKLGGLVVHKFRHEIMN